MRRAVEVAVRAVTVHEIGGRMAVGMSRRVRSEVVAAVAVASVLAVVHHHAVDGGVVGGSVGSGGSGSSGNVATVGVAVTAGILRVSIVAVRARAASVNRSRRVSVGGPAGAVATVDGASKSAVRVGVVCRVVVVSIVVSVSFAVHRSRSGTRGAARARGRD